MYIYKSRFLGIPRRLVEDVLWHHQLSTFRAAGLAAALVTDDGHQGLVPSDLRGDAEAKLHHKATIINNSTLWWTNIAMENGHWNSGFSH